ncbi:MAG: lipid II flippase MurJ, partial [Candidatus Limnocylindrales bacterium]
GIVLSADITRLLFGHGGVSEEALKATSVALAVFLVGLTAHSLIAVLARAFYAMQDTRTPVGAAIFAVAINIGAANLLVGPYGIAGLAGAIALGAWIELIVLTALLRRRLPGLGLGSVVVVMAKATVVSIAGAGVAWLVAGALVGAWGEAPGFLPLLLRICVVTAAGGIVILAGSVALRIEQLRTIVDIVVDLLRRKGRA